MSEERETVETTFICPCGIVFSENDDYDTLGSESGVCCPDCGNENFQTVKQLQEEIEKHRWITVSERMPEFVVGKLFSKDVLLLQKGREVKVGFHTKNTTWIIYGGQKEKSKVEITHWKPIILPEKAGDKWRQRQR